MYKKSRQFSFRHRGYECMACHKEEMVFGMGEDLVVCSACSSNLKKKWDNMVLTAQEVMQYVAPVVEAPVPAEPTPEPVIEQPVEAPVAEVPAAPAETAQSEAEHPVAAAEEVPAEAPTPTTF